MSANVSIVACPDYETSSVAMALKSVLEPMGGLDWVTQGMKIAIKTNLVSRMKPEAAATTHPVMLAQLCKMLIEKGAIVTVGDSPGGPFNSAWVTNIYNGCGLKLVEDCGAKLNKNFDTVDVNLPEAKLAKTFPYTAWLEEADEIIDFCKLKTHGLTGITCAVKNFFGVIPGTRKPEFHYLYPSVEGFSNMLIDLNLYVKPRLVLVDAVLCMEGNGPTQGVPRHMGALIAGDTTFNTDLVAAELIGIKHSEASTVRLAIERGLCPSDWHELDVAGDPMAFALPDFEKLPPREDVGLKRNIPFVGKFMEKAFSSHPQVDKNKCIGCGKCADHCPMKVIEIKDKKAKISRKNCISCFCCQEFCPVGAISVKRTFIAKILGK